MIRTIIQIDEDKCDGCGLCVSACHEGALGLVDGKAKLLRDDYCDGMGDCLPACPAGAITFIEREAAAYDEAAVQAHIAARTSEANASPCEGGCAANLDKLIESLSTLSTDPVSFAEQLGEESKRPTSRHTPAPAPAQSSPAPASTESALRNWPVQIKLAPTSAPYFAGCDLLIAADCTAFAHAGFHALMAGRVTLIGCPKLDSVDYAEKLSAILALNDIRSITVARMQVPCCGGIEMAAKRASAASDKDIPVEVITISTQGEILP